MFPDNEKKTTLTNLRKIHNPSLFDGIDGWMDSHPIVVRAFGAAFIFTMTVVALNLGLGRPWF